MDLYFYSDESGVFDKEHNKYFVYAGILLIGKEEKEIWNRKYSNYERNIRNNHPGLKNRELKGSVLKNKIKLKLFNKLNECQKFCVIIKQSEVNENVFSEKKNKQRFLDYAYKRAIKNILFDLIKCGKIIEEEIENIHFSIDEHSTATNGKYELSEGIKQELLYGTFNNNWCIYHSPLFEKNKKINIHDAQLCESKHEKNRMIRASDIIANRVFYLYSHRKIEQLNNIPNLHILYLP